MNGHGYGSDEEDDSVLFFERSRRPYDEHDDLDIDGVTNQRRDVPHGVNSGNSTEQIYSVQQEYEDLISRLRNDLSEAQAKVVAMESSQRDEIQRRENEQESKKQYEYNLMKLNAEIDALKKTANDATHRAEQLEIEVEQLKSDNVGRRENGYIANHGRNDDFYEKDVQGLLAIAVEEVRKHLLQLRSNSSKAQQRSAVRHFQSKYHPDKNVILQTLFEDIFKIITSEARMLCIDV